MYIRHRQQGISGKTVLPGIPCCIYISRSCELGIRFYLILIIVFREILLNEIGNKKNALKRHGISLLLIYTIIKFRTKIFCR